jgi:hypothetical protein
MWQWDRKINGRKKFAILVSLSSHMSRSITYRLFFPSLVVNSIEIIHHHHHHLSRETSTAGHRPPPKFSTTIGPALPSSSSFLRLFTRLSVHLVGGLEFTISEQKKLVLSNTKRFMNIKITFLWRCSFYLTRSNLKLGGWSKILSDLNINDKLDRSIFTYYLQVLVWVISARTSRNYWLSKLADV